jgi:hypothetical protein
MGCASFSPIPIPFPLPIRQIGAHLPCVVGCRPISFLRTATCLANGIVGIGNGIGNGIGIGA